MKALWVLCVIDFAMFFWMVKRDRQIFDISMKNFKLNELSEKFRQREREEIISLKSAYAKGARDAFNGKLNKEDFS